MIQAHLFTPVLAWLDAGAPHDDDCIGFNMNHLQRVNGDDFENNACGTACCIAGALVQFNPEAFPNIIPMSNHWRNFEEIGNEVGLDHQQTMELFFAAGHWDEDYDQPAASELLPQGCPGLSYVTPPMAAHAIRTLLETGTAKWI